MKKTQTLILAIGLMLMAAACKHDVHRYVTSDGTNRTEAEYSGKIIFNEDGTLSSMSKQSYFKVDHNGEQMTVKCNNKGEVSYINNNGDVKATPDDDIKKLMAEGIRLITNTKRGLGKR